MARKKEHDGLPTYDEMMRPTIQALIELGGSGTIEEINNKVFEIKTIPDNILQISHGEAGTINEVEYRLAWTRTYLKKYGLLNNSERGIWALTKSDITSGSINPDEIVKTVKEQHKKETTEKIFDKEQTESEGFTEEIETIENWKQNLLNTLFTISPQAFERLTQRLLRESGFIQVEVTGKTGDGGVDGKGIVRISGLLSFHVIFQCKRYKGTVTPSQIRDFRGAMQGRADKGLFISTGSFTREAIKEASRDGAPPIDLIDGELFCEKLKELKLGINTKHIENVEIDKEWFSNL
ncbi:MAG: restriction endonuclease [Elusimicrobiota bacterium]